MPNYLYLDIETIPATEAEIIAEIEASITPPGNISKAETIAAWEAEKKPALVKEAIAKTSFDGARGKVCCIGWAWDDDPEPSHATVGFTTSGEAEALRAFATTVRPSNERPVIVGHFVAGFDIRFLWQRAFVLGVKMPAWFPRDPKPWSAEVHDTMAMWAGSRDTISLDNLCKALGLPGKRNITGADVAGMWERGEFSDIAAYCQQDVERVRQVHRKMLFSMGEVA